MDTKIIAQNLVFLRKRSGLTQAQLAAHLHVSPQAVSKWEKEKSIPDIDVLNSISAFFRISVDELLNLKLKNIYPATVINTPSNLPHDAEMLHTGNSDSSDYKIKRINGLFYIIPFLAVIFFTVLFPLLRQFFYSFTSFNVLEPPKFIGLNNFIKMFNKDDVFSIALSNTLSLCFFSVIIVVPISLLLAQLIKRIPHALKTVLFLIFNIISLLTASGFGIQAFFSPTGHLNSILSREASAAEPILFTSSPVLFLFIICVIGFGPIFTMLSLALNKKIDINNDEPLLRKILFPFSISKYIYFAVVIQSIISIWSFPVKTLVFGFPSMEYRMHTVTDHIFDCSMIRFDIGYAAAVSVFSLICFLAIVVFISAIAALIMFIIRCIKDNANKSMSIDTKTKNIISIITVVLMLLIAAMLIIPFAAHFLDSFKPLSEHFIFPRTIFVREPTLQNYFNLGNIDIDKQIFKMAFVPFIPALFLTAIAVLTSYGFSRYKFKGIDVIYYICISLLVLIPFSSALRLYPLLQNIRTAFYDIFLSVVPIISVIILRNRFELCFATGQNKLRAILCGSGAVFLLSYLACFLSTTPSYGYNGGTYSIFGLLGALAGLQANAGLFAAANVIVCGISAVFLSGAAVLLILSVPKAEEK